MTTTSPLTAAAPASAAGSAALPPAQPGAFASTLAAALETARLPGAYITLGQMARTMPAAGRLLTAAGAAVGTAAVGRTAAGPIAAGPAAVGPIAAGGAAASQASPIGGGTGDAVLAAARRYLGVPYRWGGTDPATGLDCSGFVQRVFADLGVRLPRVSVDQARQGARVGSLAEARPGDLVFRRGSPNHIGIYLGEGQFIHAPRTGDVVKVAPLRWTPDEIRRVV